MAFKAYGSYGNGYTGRNYHVTGGHEAEAYEAEMSKKPNRFGILILRLLGYTGTPSPPSTKDHHPPHPG
jgi:hypothetical protein